MYQVQLQKEEYSTKQDKVHVPEERMGQRMYRSPYVTRYGVGGKKPHLSVEGMGPSSPSEHFFLYTL